MKTKQQRTFYAINYPCGLAVSGNTGNRYGTYFSFPSKKDRDKWVALGGDFRTDANWREPIPAGDLEIRAIRRQEERDPTPWSTIEASNVGAGTSGLTLRLKRLQAPGSKAFLSVGNRGAGRRIWAGNAPAGNFIVERPDCCRCGAELPSVSETETPFEFCSEECTQKPRDSVELVHHCNGTKTTTTCAIGGKPVPFSGKLPNDWAGYDLFTNDQGEEVEHFGPGA